MNTDRALTNILQILQTSPLRYRLFGVYWWAVKALLRRRFGREQLSLLGDYQDPATAALVPAMPLQETLQAALQEYAFNLAYPHPDGTVECPDGSLVTIFDEDAA